MNLPPSKPTPVFLLLGLVGFSQGGCTTAVLNTGFCPEDLLKTAFTRKQVEAKLGQPLPNNELPTTEYFKTTRALWDDETPRDMDPFGGGAHAFWPAPHNLSLEHATYAVTGEDQMAQ